ncbi:hypothetical protein ACEPAG_2961 [Sanghuangporus baumii]
MDPSFLSSSTDRYGSFSSSEQAEYDMKRDGGLHGPEFSTISSLDFDAFVSTLQAEQSGEIARNETLQDANLTAFSTQAIGQNEGYSPFTSTPLSSNCDLDTPTSSPGDLQLTLPAAKQSFSPYIEPFSAFDLSLLSSSIISSPMSLDKGDSPLHSDENNALGLFGESHASNESMHISSLGYLTGDFDQTTEDFEQHSTILDSSSNYILSPITDADTDTDMVLAGGNDHQLPFEEHAGLRATVSLVPQVDLVAGYESKGPGGPASPSNAVINPEGLYPSPSPTPQRLSLQLPLYVALNEIISTCRPKRAGAAKSKSREERNTNRPRRAANHTVSASSSSAAPAEKAGGVSPNYSADECEYGWRVWVTEGGRRIAKWKCRFCEQLVGRRPDLHRHYKTCVVKAKFVCEDVHHSDGSVWRGCGQKFSRRDACHRHLKKRFTAGRCMRRAPKKDRCTSEDDYVKKMVCFEDTNLNHEWRAALPPSEKNRMVKTALSHIKQDMF